MAVVGREAERRGISGLDVAKGNQEADAFDMPIHGSQVKGAAPIKFGGGEAGWQKKLGAFEAPVFGGPAKRPRSKRRGVGQGQKNFNALRVAVEGCVGERSRVIKTGVDSPSQKRRKRGGVAGGGKAKQCFLESQWLRRGIHGMESRGWRGRADMHEPWRGNACHHPKI